MLTPAHAYKYTHAQPRPGRTQACVRVLLVTLFACVCVLCFNDKTRMYPRILIRLFNLRIKTLCQKQVVEGGRDWGSGGRANYETSLFAFRTSRAHPERSRSAAPSFIWVCGGCDGGGARGVRFWEALASCEWPPGRGDSIASGRSELGARQQIVCSNSCLALIIS